METELFSKMALLTDREKEILRYIGDHFTSVEIADTLNLSLHTIDLYRISIMLKLGYQISPV
jgi:DNA-binding CsgD family transcriptional regulator